MTSKTTQQQSNVERAVRLSRELVGAFSRFSIDLQRSIILGEPVECFVISDAEQLDELDLPLVVALELVGTDTREHARKRAIATASRVVRFNILEA